MAKDNKKEEKKIPKWSDRHKILKTISIKGLGTWTHLYIAEEINTGKKVLRLKKFLNWWSLPDYRHVEGIKKALDEGSKYHGWTDGKKEKLKEDFSLKEVNESISKVGQHLRDLKIQKKDLSESVKQLEEIKKQSNILFFKEKLEELEERMKKGGQSETSGKDSWQKWVYDNNWIFGANYQKPIEKQKVGFDNIPDFIFPTIDGFLDILEIKKLEHEPIKKDDSHPGSFMWTSKASEAIGQVVNYIHEIELHQLELKQKIERAYPEIASEIFTIKPRAYILMGNSKDWTASQKEALRKLNYSLHGIEVLTYADLLKRGNKIIQMYSEKEI
jgi:hypothetical protein